MYCRRSLIWRRSYTGFKPQNISDVEQPLTHHIGILRASNFNKRGQKIVTFIITVTRCPNDEIFESASRKLRLDVPTTDSMYVSVVIIEIQLLLIHPCPNHVHRLALLRVFLRMPNMVSSIELQSGDRAAAADIRQTLIGRVWTLPLTILITNCIFARSC
jgi:hypothetical protein